MFPFHFATRRTTTPFLLATLVAGLWSVAAAQDQKAPMTSGLRFPSQGEWFVFWGGDTPSQNAHYAAPAQHFALDLVALKPGKEFTTHNGSGKSNSDYLCWNRPVYAPFDGKVTIAVNGVPDNVPGQMNPQMVYGNVVMIQRANGPVAVLAHLRLNSVRVKVGQQVKAGDLVGNCGNSGNSSEPHLHFHVQSQNGFEKGRGLKPFFKGVKVNGKPQGFVSPVKNDKVVAPLNSPFAYSLSKSQLFKIASFENCHCRLHANLPAPGASVGCVKARFKNCDLSLVIREAPCSLCWAALHFPLDSTPFSMQAKYLAGSCLILAALGFLVVSSLQSGTMKSVRVSQLRAADQKPQSYVGQRLRMVGFVGAKQIKKTPTQTSEGVISVAQFDVVEGKNRVLVSYSDALPDTFRAGGPVQVDGVYSAPGVMKAEHVLTKCPSKYESGEKGLKNAENKEAAAQSVSQDGVQKGAAPARDS